MVKTDQRSIKLMFRDALHMPNLSANLISIRKFDHARFLIVFMHGKAMFRNSEGKVVIVGKRNKGMYLLDNFNQAQPTTAMIATPLKIPVDLDGW